MKSNIDYIQAALTRANGLIDWLVENHDKKFKEECERECAKYQEKYKKIKRINKQLKSEYRELENKYVDIESKVRRHSRK